MSEIQKMNKKRQIVQLRIKGKELHEIAEELDTSIEWVKDVIGEAQQEAADLFIRHGQQLLAFDLIRIDALTNKYMEAALELDHKSAATVIKLLTLKSKIIQDAPKKIKAASGSTEKEVDYTFGVNSDEYEWATNLMKEKAGNVVTQERQSLEDVYAKVALLQQKAGGLTDEEILKIVKGEVETDDGE